jgi:hypothetical protein
MSPVVGANLTSNGDLLLFGEYFYIGSFTKFLLMSNLGYNSNVDVNGVSRESPHGLKRPGPTVTGVIDNRKRGDTFQNPVNGFIIQDGSIPQSLSPIIQVMLMRQLHDTGNLPSSLRGSLWLRAGKMYSSFKSLIMGPYTQGGAIQRTATYLVMSHDSNELYLTMEEDNVLLRGPAEGRSAYLTSIREMMKRAITNAGARLGTLYLYGIIYESAELSISLINFKLRSSAGRSNRSSSRRSKHE